MSRQRYFDNELEPVRLDDASLKSTLSKLRDAVAAAVTMVPDTFSPHLRNERSNLPLPHLIDRKVY